MITVIYYTSNREREQFEQKIRERLLSAIGDLPLISVSQKPIDFGHNICVGDIGVSDANVFKQLLIGCQEAKTPLIATAEADCLYPPTGYFDFRPQKVDMAHFHSNLWVLRKGRFKYRRKGRSLSALVSGREYLIQRIERRLRRWNGKEKILGVFWKGIGWEFFDSTLPVVNIKTEEGMRPRTRLLEGQPAVAELPYWGDARVLSQGLF